jgi:DNA-binding MarR family transcriptional regulator
MPRDRDLSPDDYESLAAFRHALRRFLAVSQSNAARVGLTPQQHQALLSIKAGYPGRLSISIGDLADHLLLKNNSTVELVERLDKAGLVEREPAPEDRRRILLRLTAKGEDLLAQVTAGNLAELELSVPIMARLIDGLQPEDARRDNG